MREIVKYAIFYSVMRDEDKEYIKDLEERMKNDNFIPTEEDKHYLVALDKEGKIVYEFNNSDKNNTSY